MKPIPLYPLRFEPIYQYRLWGGRRLADLLTAPLPGAGIFLPAVTGVCFCRPRGAVSLLEISLPEGT